MKVGYNGSVIDAEKAVVGVFDHGFLYGLGLFETFRTYNGLPHLLDRHLRRLTDGCKALQINYIPDGQAIRDWLAEVMEANDLPDAYVRMTVSAGDEGLGLPTGAYGKPNVWLLVKQLPATPPSVYEQGRELRLLKTVRNTPEGDIRLKSLHYMNNIIAKQELLHAGASTGAEGLLLTKEGYLSEGIVSNLFFVRNNQVCTPSLDAGILPGITRERVMELAAVVGHPVEEGLYGWDDLVRAEEIWMTSSIQELVPITTLTDWDGNIHRVGSGHAGPIHRQLLTNYRQECSKED
ncbi:4-amino-4-deoxychorismate lyase [Paenibacillus cellulosilyticus]|uniref:4-amino-4-deoxychorismate lyase n=1 Tax=Paenibacillus cellulosilyticus TaxID=375489 RepID=A0A2V2YRP4_9BACL|nr:aminotransferase class IV [Paenibacillus cellulosilyticus]PWV96019.1 4-amino-4-deoxychorismate lyase [Paenibacillus cellulosilyticus]QKS48481.1 aminotransferase class IV [Paenibacillus cellulosilyticus]